MGTTTARKIRLVARRTGTYCGRELRAGESIDATPIEAAALTHSGAADFASEKTRKPRTYRRRDLESETTS
jgi:hypothetical protein